MWSRRFSGLHCCWVSSSSSLSVAEALVPPLVSRGVAARLPRIRGTDPPRPLRLDGVAIVPSCAISKGLGCLLLNLSLPRAPYNAKKLNRNH